MFNLFPTLLTENIIFHKWETFYIETTNRFLFTCNNAVTSYMYTFDTLIKIREMFFI